MTTLVHGTPSGWRRGCNCDPCLTAHNLETRDLKRSQRDEYWATRATRFIDAIDSGITYQEALPLIGVTAQAVTAYRKRDPDFAERLDTALMRTRDENLAHGTPSAWRSRCRCPECREHHTETS